MYSTESKVPGSGVVERDEKVLNVADPLMCFRTELDEKIPLCVAEDFGFVEGNQGNLQFDYDGLKDDWDIVVKDVLSSHSADEGYDSEDTYDSMLGNSSVATSTIEIEDSEKQANSRLTRSTQILDLFQSKHDDMKNVEEGNNTINKRGEPNEERTFTVNHEFPVRVTKSQPHAQTSPTVYFTMDNFGSVEVQIRQDGRLGENSMFKIDSISSPMSNSYDEDSCSLSTGNSFKKTFVTVTEIINSNGKPKKKSWNLSRMKTVFSGMKRSEKEYGSNLSSRSPKISEGIPQKQGKQSSNLIKLKSDSNKGLYKHMKRNLKERLDEKTTFERKGESRRSLVSESSSDDYVQLQSDLIARILLQDKRKQSSTPTDGQAGIISSYWTPPRSTIKDSMAMPSTKNTRKKKKGYFNSDSTDTPLWKKTMSFCSSTSTEPARNGRKKKNYVIDRNILRNRKLNVESSDYTRMKKETSGIVVMYSLSEDGELKRKKMTMRKGLK